MQQQDQQLKIGESLTPPPIPGLGFTVRPNGEIEFQSNPDEKTVEQVKDVVKDILASVDYQRDKERKLERELSLHEIEIENRTKQVNQLTIGFLGFTGLMAILCIFLSITNQSRGNTNNGEFIRGTACYQQR